MAALDGPIIYKNNNNCLKIKQRQFVKKFGVSLVMEHLNLRQNVSILTRELRQKIGNFVGESSGESLAKSQIFVKGANFMQQTFFAGYTCHRKTNYTCQSCNKNICL